jgi:hypothetical protein
MDFSCSLSVHIQSHPIISTDVQKWPYDIQQFILSYPWTYPLISIDLSYAISFYCLNLISTLMSKHLSMDIQVHILLISSTYPEISFWIFDPGSIYPSGYSIRIQLVRLAPACSGWIALRKQLCLSIHTSGANPGTGTGSLATEHLYTTVTPSSAAAGWGLCSPVGRSGGCRRHPSLWCPATFEGDAQWSVVQ